MLACNTFRMRVMLLTLIAVWSLGSAVCAEEPAATGPRTITVALDGSGDFTSIQEAVDAAKKGDTVFITPGEYAQDLTIHSKDSIKLVGAGVDKVTMLGQGQLVGVLHVGKWPYGATNIEIRGLTINEHGGHALGIFNGERITLRDLRVKGMVFGQQVQHVRIEDCVIGGSETTGVQFADSQAVLIHNYIHDNDHGVNIAGKSEVRLEENIITRSLFEAVVVTDKAKAMLVRNTLVKNGGGVAFLGYSESDVVGNIFGLNKVGVLMAPSSKATLSFNAFQSSEHHYMRAGSPNVPAPELKADSDIFGDPRFVNPDQDDYRLRSDSPLVHVGQFPFLGALPPVQAPTAQRQQK